MASTRGTPQSANTTSTSPMEMQDPGCHAWARCEARRFAAAIMPALNVMCGLDESRREEGMKHGQQKDDRRDRVEGIRLYP